MVQVKKELREVFEEALAIGAAHEKESKRHRTTNERLMARAAENVYAAHEVGAIDSKGFAPTRGGAAGKQDAREAAGLGKPLTAKAYGMVIGYSEAYVSRLYRLGKAIDAGLVNPEEVPEPGEGPTRWQLLSRTVGDTPEVGAVLGKTARGEPTPERVDEAIRTAQERKREERAEAASLKADEETSWMPTAPGDRLNYMEELALVIHHGRSLTPKQIDRLRTIMDQIRQTIEEWMQEHVKEGEQQQNIHIETTPRRTAKA